MTIVIAETKRALYFGCIGEPGHYLYLTERERIWHPEVILGFPWNLKHLDTGLLKNGEHEDDYDGRVWWTCGGTPLWIAMFWWDNSVDRRGGSNSGFYVQGFDHLHAQEALEYACGVYPSVAQRQKFPLVLQP